MNNYHYSDFLPIEKIIQKKEQNNSSIGLVIPAKNEEKTLPFMLTSIRKELVEDKHLLDEIIVMDGNSSDSTSQIAKDEGVSVYNTESILPEIEVPCGKGTSLWKSLFVTKSDIIICVDADIKNFSTRFIYALAAPFVENPNLNFVKAYYQRPLVINGNIYEDYGGRVTEILIRPMLSAFYKELAYIYQPLSGEYGFRRNAIEQIPFPSGYGVETGILLGIYRLFGNSCIAQVDMDTRCHRNRSVKELGKMSFGILQTFILNMEKDNRLKFIKGYNKTMISPDKNRWEETEIHEMELPPAIQIRSYNK